MSTFFSIIRSYIVDSGDISDKVYNLGIKQYSLSILLYEGGAMTDKKLN